MGGGEGTTRGERRERGDECGLGGEGRCDTITQGNGGARRDKNTRQTKIMALGILFAVVRTFASARSHLPRPHSEPPRCHSLCAGGSGSHWEGRAAAAAAKKKFKFAKLLEPWFFPTKQQKGPALSATKHPRIKFNAPRCQVKWVRWRASLQRQKLGTQPGGNTVCTYMVSHGRACGVHGVVCNFDLPTVASPSLSSLLLLAATAGYTVRGQKIQLAYYVTQRLPNHPHTCLTPLLCHRMCVGVRLPPPTPPTTQRRDDTHTQGWRRGPRGCASRCSRLAR